MSFGNKPNTELKFGLAGKYKIVARKVDENGNEVSSRVAADWFSNLITDAALEDIGKQTSRDSWINGGKCVVGTGSTPPANTDTGLANQVASSSTRKGNPVAVSAQLTTPPFYHKITYAWEFGTGVAAGNLTEVGIYNSATSAPVFISRALIKDSNGNPTTITVLSDEILDVYYELYCYLPNGGADVSGTFTQTILGTDTTYNYTIRAANADHVGSSNVYTWNLGVLWSNNQLGEDDTTSYPGGASSDPMASIIDYPSTSAHNSGHSSAVSVDPYIAGSHYVDITVPFGLTQANFDIKTYVFKITGLGMFQMQIDPVLTKNNTQTHYIKYRLSWGRYTP